MTSQRRLAIRDESQHPRFKPGRKQITVSPGFYEKLEAYLKEHADALGLDLKGVNRPLTFRGVPVVGCPTGAAPPRT